MGNIRVVLNSKGIQEMLKSPEVAEMCMQKAASALSRCGDGYEMDSRPYPERKGAVIKAVSYRAKKDNLDNNTLLKAVQQ
jgi:hypothetical protein